MYDRWKNPRPVNPQLLRARKRFFGMRLERSGLVHGREFGGADAGAYFPAWLRYGRGAFMGSLQELLREQWFADAGRVRREESSIDLWLKEYPLFFISGLYGLVPAFEPIQDYNISLDGDTEMYWKKNIDSILNELVSQIGLDRADNVLVLDCCGSFSYSRLVDWESLLKLRFHVRHAISTFLEEGQIRAETGRIAVSLNRNMSLEAILIAQNGVDFVDTDSFNRHANERKSLRQLPIVGVACLNDSEKKRFADYAARQKWDDHFRFKYCVDRNIPADWHSLGVRQIICHVGTSHKKSHSTYGDLSKFSEVINVIDSYSSLELKLHQRQANK